MKPAAGGSPGPALGDVLIIGAGPVGLAAALALHRAGRNVQVIDARAAQAAARDDRMLALSQGSRELLERLGAWPAAAACAIERIHVSQRGGFGRTVLAAQDYALPALGYVVPAAALTERLAAAVRTAGITVDYDCAAGTAQAEAEAVVLPIAGQAPRIARLLVRAEGAVSEADPAQVRRRDYDQHALLCRAQAATAHAGCAWERFTPDGPIALLPLKSSGGVADAGADSDYAVVWTVAPARADALLALSDADFCAALQQAFGPRVRLIATCARGRHPLGLRLRRSPVAARTVWLGNAAQTLHPVAGQGYNLALRDVWCLAETLAAADDAGAAPVLAAYARQRSADRLGAAGFTDALVRVFGSDFAPLRHARGAGLLALDLIGPLRHFVARRMIWGARAWP